MKLTTFLLLTTCLQLSAKTVAQRVSLSGRNVSLEKVFNEVQKQTGYQFFYQDELLLNAKKIREIKVKNIPLPDLLNVCFQNQPFTYEIIEKTITVKPVSYKYQTWLQQNEVSGRVTDTAGKPLSGVSIIIVGTKKGTFTNENGMYHIAANVGDMLEFSYIGFLNQSMTVSNNTLNIKLQPQAAALDEVVVVGYGTQKKKDLTGAIATVNATQLQNENPQSMQDIMRSNIPGLSVGFSPSAKPGGDLQIRGKNTLNAGSSPLIVLDGVIYGGDISDINPNDIASIDVLKDASSVAVYGAKAAEGVIAITTKKGTTGKPVVNFNANYGEATMEVNQRPYDVNGYIKFRENVRLSQNATTAKPYQYSDPRTLPSDISIDDWLAYDGSKGDPVTIWLQRLNMTPVEIANYKAGKSIDWYDLVLHNGVQQNYTVSLSGKTNTTSYYWSAGYENNNGLVIDDKFSTVRSRLNLEATVTKFLTLGLNTQFAARNESGVPPDWNLGITNSPLGSMYNNDSTALRYSPNDQNGLTQTVNPFGAPTYTDRLQRTYTLNSNFYARVKLPFGITYQVNFTPNFSWYQYYNHVSSDYIGSGTDLQGGTAEREDQTTYNWEIDNLLTWNRTFNNIHHFEVTLLQNAEKNQSWESDMTNSGFNPNDDLGYHNIGSGIKPVESSDDEYSTGAAYMARLFYSYKERYLLTTSIRRDGYSAFGQERPWGTFPAVAAAWVFTQEPFFKSGWFNYGKLRLSYGVNGNRDIPIYSGLANLSTGKYFHVTPAGTTETVSELFVANMANPKLQWERTASYNIGLDFFIFDNILSGSIDAYKSKTTNLLAKRSLGDIIGFSYIWDNLGEVDNKGLEISLSSKNIEQKNFRWTSSLTFSMNRNKVVHLYGNMQDITDANGNVTGQREADDITNGWFIGHPLDAVWDDKVLGVWQENEADEAKKYGQQPGDFKIQDVDGDGKFTNADKQFLGTKNPKFVWSLRNEFTIHKDVSLSFLIYSQWGALAQFNQAKNNSGFIDRSSYYDLPYWTPDNPENSYARLFSSDGGATYSVWRKKSFIRLGDVSLGYTFPQQLIKKASIQNLKAYFTVRNVAFWAPDWHYWDPENSGPPPRTFTLGLNVTL